MVQSPGHDLLEPVPLKDPAAIIAAIAVASPGAVTAPRSEVLVLASASAGSASLLAMGVEPAVEKHASMLPESIVEGEWLPDEPGRIGKAVLGKSVATRLRLDLNDKLVLRGTDADDAVLVRICGLFSTGSPSVDDALMVIDQDTAGQLLSSLDEIHQVAIVLEDFHQAQAVADTLEIDGAEALTWAEAVPELGDYVALDRQGTDVMFFILFALVGLAILNSILMSVLERQRELGVLLALGTSPYTVFTMVIIEGLFLSVFSVIAGGLLGWAFVAYLGETGFDLAGMVGGGELDVEGFAFDAMIYPRMDKSRTLDGTLMVIGLTLLAALYPAWKAARVPPVEAISQS